MLLLLLMSRQTLWVLSFCPIGGTTKSVMVHVHAEVLTARDLFTTSQEGRTAIASPNMTQSVPPTERPMITNVPQNASKYQFLQLYL